MSKQEATEVLLGHVKSLLTTGAEYHDVEIICRRTTWTAHKAIIYPQSGLAALHHWHDWYRKHLIDLSEEPVYIVSNIVDFLYTANYNFVFFSSHYALHVRMYAAAHRYEIPALKKLAASRFNKSLDYQGVFPSDFIEAARVLFTAAPPDAKAMRDKVIAIAVKHAKRLYDFVEDGEQPFCKLIDDVKSFGAMFHLSAVAEYREEVEGKAHIDCQNCARAFIVSRTDGTVVGCPYCLAYIDEGSSIINSSPVTEASPDTTEQRQAPKRIQFSSASSTLSEPASPPTSHSFLSSERLMVPRERQDPKRRRISIDVDFSTTPVKS